MLSVICSIVASLAAVIAVAAALHATRSAVICSKLASELVSTTESFRRTATSLVHLDDKIESLADSVKRIRSRAASVERNTTERDRQDELKGAAWKAQMRKRFNIVPTAGGPQLQPKP